MNLNLHRKRPLWDFCDLIGAPDAIRMRLHTQEAAPRVRQMDASKAKPASRPTSRHRPVPRPGLGRDAIVTAAMEIIDARGVEVLSMRALGKHLGYEGMALYRYVDGREDVLEAVVQKLMAQLELPDPSESWESYVRTFAHRVRALAQQHPRAFPLIATRHPAAPWLRPPLRSLESVEHFLASLRAFGWSREMAVEAYQAFSSFLLGYLLLEAASAGVGTAPLEAPVDEGAHPASDTGPPGRGPATRPAPGRDVDANLDAYPTIVGLEALLRVDRTDEEFAAGLDSLIARLHERTQRG